METDTSSVDAQHFLPDYNTPTKIRRALANKPLYNILIEVDDVFGNREPQLHTQQKKVILDEVVATNTLAQAIVERRILSSSHPAIYKNNARNHVAEFSGRPVTLFGIHEFLRATRHVAQSKQNQQPFFTLDKKELPYETLLNAYTSLVHNTNLTKTHDKTYLLNNPLMPAAGVSLVSGLMLSRESDMSTVGIVLTAIGMGLTTLGAVKVADRIQYGRKLNQTAPWNTSLYLDTNLRAYADNPDLLHMTTRDVIPRPEFAGIKLKSQYYPLVLELESSNYVSQLQTRYQAAKEKKAA